MQRDDSVYLGHMLETAWKAVERARRHARAQFDADEDLRIFLAHRVQMIGEAVARVSQATRDGLPEIPWKRVVGMGHRIVHD